MRRVHLVVVVDLVADQEHFLVAPAQDVGHECVEVGDARRDFHQEQDYIGFVDGQQHLTADFVLEDVFGVDRVAARVDDRKFAAVPVGFAVMAVAGRAGGRIDDGFAFADQSVEEGRFAHVGASYDSYEAHVLSC